MPDGVYIKRKMRKAIYSGSVPGRSVTQEDSKRGEKLLRNCTGSSSVVPISFFCIMMFSLHLKSLGTWKSCGSYSGKTSKKILGICN